MSNRSIFRLHRLVIALLVLQHPAYAFEQISDELLSSVTGQDGIVIQTQADSAALTNAYWQDTMGRHTDTAITDTAATGGTSRLQANTVNLTSGTTGVPMSSTIKVNVGATGAAPALSVDILSNPSLLTANSLTICLQDGTGCDPTLGAFALQSVSNTQLSLVTTKGLLNSEGTADIRVILPDMRFYLTYATTGTSPETNQLVGQIRTDVSATGRLWIDAANGFRFSTTRADGSKGAIKFTAGTNFANDPTQSGLNLAFLQRPTAAIAGTTYALTGARGLIRFGITGSILNSDVYLRGVSSQSAAADSVLGFATAPAASGVGGTTDAGNNNRNILGSTGIVMRVLGDFSRGNDQTAGTTADADPFSLEIGEVGTAAYGVRFLNHVAFSDPTKRGNFDSGSVYLNLGITNSLTLPTNSKLLPNTSSALSNANLLSDASAFQHVIQPYTTPTSNPRSVIVAVRGLEVQSLPTHTVWVSSSDLVGAQKVGVIAGPTTPTSYSLVSPLYGVNADIALFGETSTEAGPNTRERLGFGLGVTTTGIDPTGTKTTSVLLVDGGKRYFGLRNIDSLITAQGSLEIRSDRIRINLPNFLIAFSGEVAAGYFPLRTKTDGTTETATNFNDPKDVLSGLKVKLQGATNSTTNRVDVITQPATASNPDQNYLGIEADLTLANSSIQISDPDGSKMGFDSLSGRLRLDGGCLDLSGPANQGCLGLNRPTANANSLAVQGHLTVNPAQTAADVLKTTVNFYAAPTATTPNPIALPLAQLVLTGAKLYGNVVLSPR